MYWSTENHYSDAIWGGFCIHNSLVVLDTHSFISRLNFVFQNSLHSKPLEWWWQLPGRIMRSDETQLLCRFCRKYVPRKSYASDIFPQVFIHVVFVRLSFFEHVVWVRYHKAMPPQSDPLMRSLCIMKHNVRFQKCSVFMDLGRKRLVPSVGRQMGFDIVATLSHVSVNENDIRTKSGGVRRNTSFSA